MDSVFTLADNQVDVWYCLVDDPKVVSQQDQYLHLLTDDELARHRRFVFEKDRQLFLLARTLLRTTLSRYAPRAPKAWRFEQTLKGKLFLAEEEGIPRLTFNVSHSGRMAVCAVARQQPVGVDVESRSRHADPRVASYFMSESEMARYSNATGDQKSSLFYRYWTLKEAYAKALGMGLSLRFTDISFELEGTHPTLHPLLPAEPQNSSCGDSDRLDSVHWHFHQELIESDYYLAVAIHQQSAARPHFTVRYMTPDLSPMTRVDD